jgi:hypothetical protein
MLEKNKSLINTLNQEQWFRGYLNAGNYVLLPFRLFFLVLLSKKIELKKELMELIPVQSRSFGYYVGFIGAVLEGVVLYSLIIFICIQIILKHL